MCIKLYKHHACMMERSRNKLNSKIAVSHIFVIHNARYYLIIRQVKNVNVNLIFYPGNTKELCELVQRCLCVQVKLEFRNVGFCGGGKTEKNPRSKEENQQETQPTYDTEQESNLGHIGGRRVLSPLRHTCYPDKIVCKIHHIPALTDNSFIMLCARPENVFCPPSLFILVIHCTYTCKLFLWQENVEFWDICLFLIPFRRQLFEDNWTTRMLF